MKIWKAFFCAVLSLSLLLGAACAEPFKPVLDTGTSAEVRVYGNYSNFEALESAFEHFNAIYPNVDLSFTKPDDYNNTIGMILTGKNAPDIYFSYTWMYGKEPYVDVLAQAENLADPAFGIDRSCVRPTLLTESEDGTVQMLPVFSTTHGMLVNNDLFAREGLEVPATWSELLSVCAALKEKGYESPMMGFVGTSSSNFIYSIGFPMFCAALAAKPDLIPLANKGDPAAGEAMRLPLLMTLEMKESGCFDLDVCAAQVEDNYSKLILRFFEGDVPMIICPGDTVSGTRKRESQSDAFQAHPFTYTYYPVPVTEKGGYFLDASSVEFSVNRDAPNLDMANEFMRFLMTTEELNSLAEIKRLVTASTDMTFDSVYAPFASVPADRIISPEALGIMDNATIQYRVAAWRVGTGAMTVDEAVAAYGTFTNE